MEIGDQAFLKKVISEEDIIKFAEITLDTNPIHIDEDYAKNSIFGNKIVHGMLSSGLISAVIGTKLPGPGSIYLSQLLNFKKPVYANDEITAIVTITDIVNKENKQIIVCSTICKNQAEDVVLDGEAKLMLFN